MIDAVDPLPPPKKYEHALIHSLPRNRPRHLVIAYSRLVFIVPHPHFSKEFGEAQRSPGRLRLLRIALEYSRTRIASKIRSSTLAGSCAPAPQRSLARKSLRLLRRVDSY